MTHLRSWLLVLCVSQTLELEWTLVGTRDNSMTEPALPGGEALAGGSGLDPPGHLRTTASHRARQRLKWLAGEHLVANGVGRIRVRQ